MKNTLNLSEYFNYGASEEEREIEFQKIYSELENELKNLSESDQAIKLSDTGLIAKRIEKFKIAEQLQIRSIKIIPNNGMAYYNLAKVLYLNRKFEEAQRAYVIAKINNVKEVSNNTLYTHIGHAVLDNISWEDCKDEDLKMNLFFYGTALIGLAPRISIDPYYEKKCLMTGKDRFRELLKEFNSL